MTEPDRNDSAPSEKSKPDAVSPPAGIHPNSPPSRLPPGIRALDAPLTAVPGPKSRRPAASAAPRRRSAEPPGSPNNIGPAAPSQPPLTSDVEISATQELADALSNLQSSQEPEVMGSSPEASPSAPAAPSSQTQLLAGSADPLSVRRTLIPILLTGSVILAGAGALLLFGGEDNALSDLFPSWVPILFCLLASVFLGFAVLNMFAVKNAKR